MTKSGIRVLLTGLLLLGAPAARASTIVNIDAKSEVGTTISLSAGTYSISYTSATYMAWNAWQGAPVAGCDGNGANCTNGYIDTFGIDFGHKVGNFDRKDGLNFAPGPSAGTGIYKDAATALAAYQVIQMQVGNLPLPPSGYSNVAYPFTFTLASDQAVNFFVYDTIYSDNTGGVSLNIQSVTSAVPEPSTWAMMVLGFAGLGFMAYRKRGRLIKAA